MTITGPARATTADVPVALTATLVAPGFSGIVTDRAQWISRNPEVATVSHTGLVFPVRSGQAQIVATYEGVEGQMTMTVALPVIDITGDYRMAIDLSPSCWWIHPLPQRQWIVRIQDRNAPPENILIRVLFSLDMPSRLIAGELPGEVRGNRLGTASNAELLDVVRVSDRDSSFAFRGQIYAVVHEG